MWQVKFNRLLYPNEPPQRIISYLARQLSAGPSKIGHFQFSESIFETKTQPKLHESDFLIRIPN